MGEDPKCAYDALWAWWQTRVREVLPSARGTAPLFAHVEGVAITTSQVAAAVRKAALAAGERPADFDARALRIGGATDLYHLFDAAEVERIIADRGRWTSDIKD